MGTSSEAVTALCCWAGPKGESAAPPVAPTSQQHPWVCPGHMCPIQKAGEKKSIYKEETIEEQVQEGNKDSHGQT